MPYYLIAALIGFIIGKFLGFWCLAAVTLLCVAIIIWLTVKMEEKAKIITLVAVSVALVGNGVMWVTYYNATGQTWLGDFVHQHLLR